MTRATSVQQQFGPNAECYARAAYFAHGADLDDLIAVVKPQLDWLMLDIATGGGHCAMTIAPLVAHVTATDITTEMLSAASSVACERGLGNLTFEPANAEALPYTDAGFDLVTCRIAAHHFDDPGQAVREFARVTKRGGFVALVDPIVPYERAVADEINAWDTVRDPSHVTCLTVNGWSSLFCAADLAVVHVNTFEVSLDFDDLMSRSSRDVTTVADLRRRMLNGSRGLQTFFKPREDVGRLTFTWTQMLIVGRK